MARPVVTWKGTPYDLQVMVAALKIAAEVANYQNGGAVLLGPHGHFLALNEIVPGGRGMVSQFRLDAFKLIKEIGME